MKIGERYLFIARFLQNGCQIGDFCGGQGEEWMRVQEEEQLQEGDATQTGQAEHLTMQNAQYKTSRISHNAKCIIQDKQSISKCRKSRISQSTMQEKQNVTVYCRQVLYDAQCRSAGQVE